MGTCSDAVEELMRSSVVLPNYLQHLSRAGQRIQDNKLRALFNKEMGLKKTIKMSNGVPNNDSLPINGIQFTLRDGSNFRLSEQEVAEANNYGQSEGLKPLRQWLLGLHKLEHKPPQMIKADHPEPFELALSNGNTESIKICFQLLLNEGDCILFEKESYSTTLSLVDLFGVVPVTVKSDEKGMIAEDLENLLKHWSVKHPNLKRPKVMYTITSCNNPTGNTWTADAMARVYKLCRKYDIIIIEDAAYYFLQFEQREPGFQSLDVDGRVIRLDSFSKLIGPGYRVGWTSGPASFIRRFSMCLSQSTVHPCVLSQLMINNILQSWGYETFLEEMKKLSEFYHKRAQHLASALEKYMKDLATWRFPSGGMFFWVKIFDFEDTFDLMKEAFESGVTVASGNLFVPHFKPSGCIRLSFTLADEVEMEEGMKILANVITATKKRIQYIKCDQI